jgi:hypothetical protein
MAENPMSVVPLCGDASTERAIPRAFTHHMEETHVD